MCRDRGFWEGNTLSPPLRHLQPSDVKSVAALTAALFACAACSGAQINPKSKTHQTPKLIFSFCLQLFPLTHSSSRCLADTNQSKTSGCRMISGMCLHPCSQDPKWQHPRSTLTSAPHRNQSVSWAEACPSRSTDLDSQHSSQHPRPADGRSLPQSHGRDAVMAWKEALEGLRDRRLRCGVLQLLLCF